jgi:hypothetical protein
VIFFVFLTKISTNTADFGPKICFKGFMEEWLHTARKITLKTYKFGNNFHKKTGQIHNISLILFFKVQNTNFCIKIGFSWLFKW